MIPVYVKVAREVRRRNIPQLTLAKDLKMSQSKISLTLSGKRKMTGDELFAFCEYFGVDPNYFFGDIGWEEDKCVTA